jgi:tol-pal system protein YbgF
VRLRAAAVFGALLGVACATSGSVKRVETQVAVMRAQMTRQDSARAAELGRIIQLQQRILDSLTASRETLRREMAQQFLDVQQQLVQVQELTGQSQRRLSELKRQLDDRSERLSLIDTTPAAPAAPAPAAPADTVRPAPPPGTPTPDQLYQSSLQELRRGSLATARVGFREFLRTYPTHAQVPDALYFMGETFAVENADSAAAYYRQVVERFRTSDRAPTSLYKTGLLAEQRQNRPAAQAAYQRLLQQYPRSPEANLARDRLAALKP